MKSSAMLHSTRQSGFFSLPFSVNLRRLSRRMLVLTAALALLPLATSHGWAQQIPQAPPQDEQAAPPPADEQAPPPPDYDQPQTPNAQPAQPYAEPQYAQPQQQPYSQPQQQPYAPPQQPYAQAQPYPGQQQAYADPNYPNYGQSQPYAAQPQAMSEDQLEQMVAPIALYPDGLLAQVLAAATYPTQVAEADRWRQSMGDAPPDAVAAGANAQPWDPSVKALTAFPQVLQSMDQNLNWTTALGNAYYNQPQDVMNAVQAMRQRAQAAGNLQSTPQETVTDDQGYIALAPANPTVVYVPAYNPWAVYGAPIAPWPGYSLLGGLAGFFGPIQYGVGLVMSAFLHMAWGWGGWGIGWGGHSLLYHNQMYFSRSNTLRDWGLAHGGPRAYYGRGQMAGRGYGRGQAYAGRAGMGGSYGRPASGYMPSRNAPFRQSESYRGYAGQSYARPSAGYAGQNYARPGMNSYGNSYSRGNQMAMNRMPEMPGRTQSYGSGFYNRPSQSYGQSYTRPQSMPQMTSRGYGSAWGGGMNGYRAPTTTYRAAAPQMGRSFGGFSGYSGHASSGSFGGSRSFGGGHSFGGGSHFSGGGGHSSGGGGHSSGGHGGGGHHR